MESKSEFTIEDISAKPNNDVVVNFSIDDTSKIVFVCGNETFEMPIPLFYRRLKKLLGYDGMD